MKEVSELPSVRCGCSRLFSGSRRSKTSWLSRIKLARVFQRFQRQVVAELAKAEEERVFWQIELIEKTELKPEKSEVKTHSLKYY